MKKIDATWGTHLGSTLAHYRRHARAPIACDADQAGTWTPDKTLITCPACLKLLKPSLTPTPQDTSA